MEIGENLNITTPTDTGAPRLDLRWRSSTMTKMKGGGAGLDLRRLGNTKIKVAEELQAWHPREFS